MIEIGGVYLLWCHVTNPPKEKFCVCVRRQPTPLFFLVNTEIHAYIQDRPELLRQQVELSATTHKFLDHDSWVDCKELIGVHSVEEQLQDDPAREKGVISRSVARASLKAVANSKTLQSVRIREICEGLREFTRH